MQAQRTRRLLIYTAILITAFLGGLLQGFLSDADPTNAELTATAQQTADAQAVALTAVALLESQSADQAPCGWMWVTQPQADFAAQVNETIRQAGVLRTEAAVSAYGENCLNPDGSVRYFAAMETSFTFIAAVDDRSDDVELGQRVAQLLQIVEQLTPEIRPGPNPGTLTFVFTDATGESSFSVPEQDALSIFAETRDRTALIAALREASS